MITARFTAPAALLHRFQHLVAPLHPDGGWLAAVAEAIEAGLDEGEAFPWPPQRSQQAEGQAQQEQVQRQVQQPAAEPQQEQEVVTKLPGGEAPAAAAIPPPAAEAGVADAAPAGVAEAPPLRERQPLAAVPAGGGAPVVVLQHEGLTGGQALPGRPSVLLKPGNFTEMSERRLRWVLARIGRSGFLLASELPRFLQVCWGLRGGGSWPVPGAIPPGAACQSGCHAVVRSH